MFRSKNLPLKVTVFTKMLLQLKKGPKHQIQTTTLHDIRHEKKRSISRLSGNPLFPFRPFHERNKTKTLKTRRYVTMPKTIGRSHFGNLYSELYVR
jgi:hypothetical protein